MNIKKIVFSPPIGIYLNFKKASSVYGSYTLHKRKGLIKQIIKTLRPTKKGWVNKIGLRNVGIAKLNLKHKPKDIVSVASLHENDFAEIFKILIELKNSQKLKTNNIELNISCPNANVLNIKNETLQDYLNNFNVILKMPHNASYGVYHKLILQGVRVFHVSNTTPTVKGALSGKTLKPTNIKTIKTIRRNHKEIYIIAGGGIQNYYDLLSYKNAGGNSFSISSLCFNPFKFLFFIAFLCKKGLL